MRLIRSPAEWRGAIFHAQTGAIATQDFGTDLFEIAVEGIGYDVLQRTLQMRRREPEFEMALAVEAHRNPRSFAIARSRTAPGERKPYQRGVAGLYLQLKVPVVPVALNSGLYWGRRSFVKRPGTVVVEFLPPILPGLDKKRFLAELEERIETATAWLVAGASVHKSVDNFGTQHHEPL